MASSTENVKLGVCRVYRAGRDLGLTKGGVEISVTSETYVVEVDQYGKAPIKEQIQGRVVQATVPMAETVLDQIRDLMPGSTLVTDGAQAKASLAFTGNPADGDTVTIDGNVFVFKASPDTTDPLQVARGMYRDDSMDNLTVAVNRYGIRRELGAIAVKPGATAGQLDVVVNDMTDDGNGITLTATSTSVTASAATLTGGKSATRSRIEVSSGAGIDLLKHGAELRFHPTEREEHDYSEDFVIYWGATAGEMNFAYKVDAERIFNATFKGYPHPKHGKLFAYGDQAAVNA